MPACWASFSPSTSNLTPLVRDFVRTLSLLGKRGSQVDTLPFLTSLQRSFAGGGNPSFRWNQQQDVPEIFYQLNLEVEKSLTSDCWNSISPTFKETVQCNTCSYVSIDYVQSIGIQVSVSQSIADSINGYIKPETLSGENSWFCPACQIQREATKQSVFTEVPDVLIVQLNRWVQHPMRSSFSSKDSSVVRISDDALVVPVHVDNEVVVRQPLRLMSVICHAGTLNNGHYYTYAKHGSDWFRLNDKAVLKIDNSLLSHSLDNKDSYLVFYSSH